MAKKATSKKSASGGAASKEGTDRAPSRQKVVSTKKESAASAKAKKARTSAPGTKVPRIKAYKGRSQAARRIPDIIGLRTQHVDFLSYKVEQVRKFYGEVLGFATEKRESSLNYLFVRTTESSSIGFMPPHPEMIGEQPHPREPTLYFLVEDVDHAYAILMAKGVAFMGPPQEMPWGDRVITTTDPEGRTVMLGSEIEK